MTPHRDTTPQPEDGFVFSRDIPVGRDQLFDHFTQPEGFSRWFVVPGFDTPAERLRLDPRPGGSISGFMVSQADGSEIPFTATYGVVEPPRTVELVFTGPDESVTITLDDLGDAATRLTYRNRGSAAEDREGAIAAARAMFDGLA